MPTACKFSEMPLFVYLSLTLLRSLFKKFENKCKRKHEVHVYDRPLPCLFANAITVLTVDFQMAFFFSYFIQLCDSRKIHYLTRECHVKLHLKTDIARIANIGFRVQFNAEFPRQVMNFPIVL